jgi:hypothetical protein
MNWLLQENIHKEVELLPFWFLQNLIFLKENNWGVATESVFDFFKPRRIYKRRLEGAPEIILKN